MDRKFVGSALIYALLGVLLGMHMMAANNHSQMPTHAHILLVGFVLSFIYGLIHKLWLANPNPGLSQVQYYLHQIGTLVLIVCLYLKYSHIAAQETLSLALNLSSFTVFVGILLMAILFFKKANRN
ncbi:MAG TPA: TonB-dependent receptor [Calditrichaeota bacterium]|nr:TonB-dependent receptor [Calditrichota bacterium]